jgi:hypothetical protein
MSLVTGCSDADFEEFYEITKLRVIGIAAEPPDVAPEETVEFEAVTATPDEFGDVFYAWQMCILTDGADEFYACSDDSISTGEDSFEFPNVLAEGTGREFEFTQNLFSAEELIEACTILAQAQDFDLPDFIEVPACTDGFPVYVRVVACEGQEPPCEEPEIAYRRYKLLLQSQAERDDRNNNPLLRGVLVENEEVSEGETPSFTLNEERELKLTALVNADQAEEYLPVDSFDFTTQSVVFEEETQREILGLSWFSTAGDMDRNGFYSADGRAPIEELQTNVLSFDEGEIESPTVVQLWLVLRDQRDGLAWIQRAIEVRPAE